MNPPRNRKDESGNPLPTVNASEFYPNHHPITFMWAESKEVEIRALTPVSNIYVWTVYCGEPTAFTKPHSKRTLHYACAVAKEDMNARNFVASGYDNVRKALRQFVALGKPRLIAALVFVHCCVAAAQTAPPTITGFLVDGVKSNRAAVGATLTIQGKGFGATIGFSVATLGGIALAGAGTRAISWSDTSIVAVIPQTAESGPVVVKVAEQGTSVSSNRPNLYVRVEIIGIMCDSGPCNSGPVGTPMTLAGNGFGTTGGKVTFNGEEAVTSGWGDSGIVTVVPAGATTGPIRVTVAGQVSNGWHFTVTP